MRHPSICSLVSVKVRREQSGSTQRNRRFRQMRRTGLPTTGRSRTWTIERPWPIARPPQSGQPTRAAVVSTSTHHSPSCSSMASTTNPSMPSSAVSAAATVVHVPCPSDSRCPQPQESRATGPYRWMPMGGSPATAPHAPSRRAGFRLLPCTVQDRSALVDASLWARGSSGEADGDCGGSVAPRRRPGLRRAVVRRVKLPGPFDPGSTGPSRSHWQCQGDESLAGVGLARPLRWVAPDRMGPVHTSGREPPS